MSTEAQRGGEASNTDTNDKFRSRGASKGKLGRKKSAYATLRVQAKEGVADRIKQYSGAGGAGGAGGGGGERGEGAPKTVQVDSYIRRARSPTALWLTASKHTNPGRAPPRLRKTWRRSA